MSPVFHTADELAVWMSTPEGGEVVGIPGRGMRLEDARAFLAQEARRPRFSSGDLPGE